MARETRAWLAVRCAGPFVILLGAACAGTEAMPQSPRRFVTPIDVQEGGRVAVEAFLDGLEESQRDGLRSAMQRGRAATARLAVGAGADSDGGEETALGSCVLLEDGRRFLTAAHILWDRGENRATVVPADGRRLRARVLASGRETGRDGSGDWAILESTGAARHAGLPLARRRPEVGELVVVLGFPQGSGLGVEGHVRSGVFDDRQRLSACTLIARVLEPGGGAAAALVLEPVAGSLNAGGMSGGPVLDASGGILGVLGGTVVRLDDAGAATDRLEACSVDALDARLGAP